MFVLSILATSLLGCSALSDVRIESDYSLPAANSDSLLYNHTK